MKPFQAIAAMSLNRVIGAGNKIPWHLPEDFKWFKATTTGHILVMGRKTFESIGKPLPHRETIVLSHGAFSFPGVRVIHNLAELTRPTPSLAATLSTSGAEQSASMGEKQIFICGGAQIYEQTLPLCSDLYLTLVKREVEGDAFFPPFEDQFELAGEILERPEFKILHYRRQASSKPM
jgi:dihydrofolate reductase